MNLLNHRRSLMSVMFLEKIIILPEEYQEVEFLENTGTQFIDTEFVPNNNMSIDIVYQAINYNSSQYILGSREGQYTTIEFALNGSGSRTDWDLRFGGVGIYGQTYGVGDRNSHKWRSKVSITNGTGYWEITDLDEVITKNITFSNKKVNTTSSLMLFAYNSFSIHSNLRIYGCKIHDGKTLVRDFIPCYRKTDGMAGLFDTANNKFYTNVGAGAFIVGDDVSYEKLRYIESTGTQYIDTGIVPNQNTGFDVVYVTSDGLVGGNTGYGAILGGRESSKENELQLTTYTQDGSGLSGTLRFGNTDNNAGISIGVKMHSTLKNQVYTNNTGVTYELNDTAFISPVSLTVFALNNNGTVSQFGKVKLYSLKIYDGNTLLRDFIPCCRTNDNKLGLYDAVRKKFYTNAGTGDFIAGGNA